MNLLTQVGLGLTALALSFTAGYVARKPEVVVETKTEVKTEVKEVEKIVRQVVKEKTTKPDGTVIERTTKNTQSDTTTRSKARSDEVAQVVAPAPASSSLRPDYSVGAKWTPRWDQPEAQPNAVEVGYRVLGNAWVTGEYDWRDRDVSVGIRVEF